VNLIDSHRQGASGTGGVQPGHPPLVTALPSGNSGVSDGERVLGDANAQVNLRGSHKSSDTFASARSPARMGFSGGTNLSYSYQYKHDPDLPVLATAFRPISPTRARMISFSGFRFRNTRPDGSCLRLPPNPLGR